MSKWIGETEKNLDTAFSEAEGAGAVLLFDEADALFSRRTPATDAHARHANLEVAYLLQRMEAFTGLAILTTNLRHNLDEAFLRRLRFVIEFPKPDASAREKIWRQCFSGVAQLSDSVNLADLGRRIEVPGGNIRQIALRAAFAARGRAWTDSDQASARGSQGRTLRARYVQCGRRSHLAGREGRHMQADAIQRVSQAISDTLATALPP